MGMRTRRESYVSHHAEEQINAVVDAVIAEHGFRVAIPWLIKTVSDLAETALADPSDASKARKYAQWSRALQAALRRGGVLGRTFEQRINEADAIRARGLGIRLD